MKLKLLTPELCLELIAMGFTHLTIKYNSDNAAFCCAKGIVTFQAIKFEDENDSMSIPIAGFNSNEMKGSYIMIKN